jgi:ribosomal protein L21E
VRKFKKGDNVRVVRDKGAERSNAPSPFVGEEGVVVGLDFGGVVVSLPRFIPLPFDEDELELIKED